MEISSTGMASATTTKVGFKQRPYGNNNSRAGVGGISCRCRADTVAMQRGKINFYELLSLGYAENVGLSDIKKAYRRLVLQYHPDVCPSSAKEECTKQFLELQRAYETLSDLVSRQMYDYELGLRFGVMEDRRSKFPRHVWEKQLDGLKKRSQFRMQKMKHT